MGIRRRGGRQRAEIQQGPRLSQETLVLECGLHHTDISGGERRIRDPTALAAIAAALKGPAWRLLADVVK